jgi:hypothetical protein
MPCHRLESSMLPPTLERQPRRCPPRIPPPAPAKSASSRSSSTVLCSVAMSPVTPLHRKVRTGLPVVAPGHHRRNVPPIFDTRTELRRRTRFDNLELSRSVSEIESDLCPAIENTFSAWFFRRAHHSILIYRTISSMISCVEYPMKVAFPERTISVPNCCCSFVS